MSSRYTVHPMEQSFVDWENERRRNPPRKLPVFFDGVGIDRDNLGYIVVYGDEEKYVLSSQRYDTFDLAKESIDNEQ